MRPDQSGFVLPSAIFLLVVLGGLAAWLNSVTQATQAQAVLELEGERAYQAAQAGLEAGIHLARQPGNTCVQVAQDIAFTGNLARFTASLSCAGSSADEGGATRTFFEITSVACNQPDAGACPNAAPTLPEYVERQLRATVDGG